LTVPFCRSMADRQASVMDRELGSTDEVIGSLQIGATSILTDPEVWPIWQKFMCVGKLRRQCSYLQ
jgi:hypothetical protein